MRICDLTTLYIDGGAGGVNTYLREKARFLSRLDGSVEHTVIVPAARSRRLSLFGSTVHAIQSPRLPGNPEHRVLVNFAAVGRALEGCAPDVVEVDCAYLLGHVVAAALPRRRPLLVGFHHVHLPFHAGCLGRRPGAALRQIAERFAWRYLAYCVRPLDRLLVPSLDIQERLRARGLRGIEHVPLGVNLELFQPAARSMVHGPVRTVLYVGRLSEEKDLRVLFEAYRLLAGREPRLRLLLVGDGPLRPCAERFARGRSDVVVHGLAPYGPELARLYAGADALVMPSRNETFSLAVVEALASGLPVVAIRRGGPREMITPEVGALARPGEPADLAEKISQVLARGHDARRSRLHAERHYSWDRTFRRLLEIYEGAGARARAAPVADRRRTAPTPDAVLPSPLSLFQRGGVS